MKDAHSKVFLWQSEPWDLRRGTSWGGVQHSPLQLFCDQGSVQVTEACCVTVWERERKS